MTRKGGGQEQKDKEQEEEERADLKTKDRAEAAEWLKTEAQRGLWLGYT